jgi:hypothetical protein
MKYFLTRLPGFLVALSFFSLSCGLSQAQNPSRRDPRVETKQEPAPKTQAKVASTLSPAPLEIATYDLKTKRIANFRGTLLTNKFEDGTNITSMVIERVGNKFFLVRSNVGRNSCRTSWTALIDSGKGDLSLSRTNVSTDTCTGNPCSWCKLVAPGGPCDCRDGVLSKCNHSTTQTSGAGLLKATTYAQ